MTEQIDSAALLRFVSGASPAAERVAVEQWMSAAPVHRAEVERLTRAWDLAGRPRDPGWDTAALWRRIESQLEPTAAHGDPVVRQRDRRTQGRPLVLVPVQPRPGWATVLTRFAAAAAIVVGIVAASRVRVATEPVQQAVAPPMRTVATKRGERVELRMADGSRVVLGPASTLRIPATYGDSARDLYLDGEAYFEVKHDDASPMRVHTARTVTEDLGTRFVVSAFDDQATARVAVAEGVVAFRGGSTAEPVVLQARDVGHLSVGGAVRAVRGVAVDRYFSWIDGVIRFDNEKMVDAVPVLERQYDIDIQLASSSLAQRRFTGSFRAGNVDEFLRGLAFLLDAHYERQGRIVRLTPRR